MSRIIVKNLPKSISAKKLEDLFSSKGCITDLQLKYNKDGVFRQFAFVGYKTEEEAEAAKNFFHHTFVNTSKIEVDICTSIGDPHKPKPWKKTQIGKNEETRLSEKVKEKTPKKSAIDEEAEELMKDAQFKEFLEVNKDRKSKPIWSEAVDESDGNESESADETSEAEVENDNIQHAAKATEVKEESPIKTGNKSLKPQKIHDDQYTVKIRNLPYLCKKKQVKQFFQPLKIVSLRLPPKSKGFAFIKFKTEKDMNQALIKNKGFLDGHRVDVIKYSKKADGASQDSKFNKVENPREKNEELLAETGRIYVRNLCFSVTENEVEDIFKKYGPLAEVHLPVDFLTKKAQGFAFITYMFPEHAIKAFSELDGTIFQGRLLHLIPSNPKKEHKVVESDPNFKKKKEAKLKNQSGNSHNWNILFLGQNAVADVIAQKYNIEKSKLLSGDSKESVAVRMALAETNMVMENRKFLVDNGVKLDAFSQAAAERSKTVIVAKHLPANSTSQEINEVFAKFGTISRVVLPPSGVVALIEFDNPTEAKTAFKKLAYTRFRHLPLFLEWAPMGALVDPPVEEEKTDTSTLQTEVSSEKNEAPTINDNKPIEVEKTKDSANEEIEPNLDGTTLFVKNISFETTDENLKKHFKKCGPINYAAISTKQDVKTGKLLSMGFGFVQFKNKKAAVEALQNKQHSSLDGRVLELKFANRAIEPTTSTQRRKYEEKKQSSAKILVRNIAFQASESEVRALFKQFGDLKSVRLPKKLGESGEHRGFGFIEYHTEDNAQRAFDALCHSTHLFQRRLVLEWAAPDSQGVDHLRHKTALAFHAAGPAKKLKKTRLLEDVALASSRYGAEEND